MIYDPVSADLCRVCDVGDDRHSNDKSADRFTAETHWDPLRPVRQVYRDGNF